MTADADVEKIDGKLSSAGVQASLGYGLFWRPDLNWKFLAWQWKQDTDNSHDRDAVHESIQV